MKKVTGSVEQVVDDQDPNPAGRRDYGYGSMGGRPRTESTTRVLRT